MKKEDKEKIIYPKEGGNGNNEEIKDNISMIDKQNDIYSKVEGLVIRIAVFGEQKCGKTALINCYLNKDFSLEQQDTILNIYAKKIRVCNYHVTLVIMEVSEDQSDASLLTQITGEAHIIFLCYSLEDDIGHFNESLIEESLNNIKKIEKNIPIFIVGCKFDLLQEEAIDVVKVFENEATLTSNGQQIKDYINNKRKSWSNTISGYYITSALLNINVEKLFLDAIKTVALPFILVHIEKKKEKEKQSKKSKKSKGNSKDTATAPSLLTVNDSGCFVF